MDYKIGAHLSINGGYGKALSKIKDIGGNCLQMFSASPRGWNFAKISLQDASEFKESKAHLAIDPVYFHASYLINLADAGRIGHLSKMSLRAELETASKLGIKGSIVHLGSFKNEMHDGKYSTLIANIKEVLAKTPSHTLFMIENAGNRKIGRSLDEISNILHDINNDRVRICLDTCHLYSAGYNLTTPENLNAFLKEFEEKVGIDKLELWHVNDSRDPFGSLRDRHENIGEGTLGLQTFKLLLNHEKMKHLPFIIETPGFDQKGPDKRNLDILKKLA